MAVRSWLKLMDKLPPDVVQTVCTKLLDVEEETANDAIKSIQSLDYKSADENIMELYNIIQKWESSTPCANAIKSRHITISVPQAEEIYAGVG